MKALETYVNEINESSHKEVDAAIAYDHSDSLIMKIVKTILRWFDKLFEHEEYNPASKKYNQDATNAALDDYISHTGRKYVKSSTKTISEKEIKSLCQQGVLPYIDKDMKQNPALYKDLTWKRVDLDEDIKDVSKKGVPGACYGFNKGLYKYEGKEYMFITNVEGIGALKRMLNPKNVLRSMLSDLKQLNGAQGLIVRFSDENSYEQFLDFLYDHDSFARIKAIEQKFGHGCIICKTMNKRNKQ